MRFGNYVNETTNTLKGTPDNITLIKRECSEFLKELKSGKNILHRASRKFKTLKDSEIIIVPYRTGRAPVDTPEKVHKYIDNLLFEKFGWYPRSESLFCWIQNKNRSETILSIRIVIPANGYKYVYSPIIRDIYENYSRFGRKQDFVKWFKEELLPTYKDKNALNTTFHMYDSIELMLKAKKYYLLSVDFYEKYFSY